MLQTVGRCRVAGDDNYLDRIFLPFRLLRPIVFPELPLQQEKGIFHSQLAQVVGLALTVVAPIRHICLVGQILEVLVLEIGNPVGFLLTGLIVESVLPEYSLKHSESSRSTVEYANGQIAQ